MTPSRIIAALAVVAASAMAAPRWEMRYFYDEDESSISLRQIEFLSPQRGLAVGVLNKKGDSEGVALLTTDGGKTWTTAELPDHRPMSLFCQDEASCWLVGAEGIYFSAEGGRDWKRVSREKLLTRIAFTSRERGFAVGARRKLLETRDGGRTWKKMPVADSVKTSEDRTVFHVVAFITPKIGVIAGRTEPLRLLETPIWMDPDPTDSVEFPTITAVLQTRDGGEKWEVGTTSIFGRISQLRGTPKTTFGIALVEYDRYFRHPSELLRIDFKTGSSDSVIARKDFAVTDVAVKADGAVYAAGFRPIGTLARTPVPGKVRVLSSSGDLKLWMEMDVDYRAVANRVSITTAPDGNLWMATDTGMILQLQR